ncbi:hypothetical protein PIROE2DRAFT_6979, partial [Piromyces sp. E2]
KPPEHYVHRKLKKFTNERPPSELITSNFDKFFSEDNNRKSLKMIYDEDSAEGNILKPDDRPALSNYNSTNTSPRSNSDKYLNGVTSPYTKFNTIDRMQKLTTTTKSSSNNDVYATIDRITYKTEKYNSPSKGSSLDKFSTIDRDRLYSSEKNISESKSSSKYLNSGHKYHASEHSLINIKYHHDGSGKEPSIKSSSKSDKYGSSRSKHATIDRRKRDKHIHRHRRDSPSTERHRRDSPSTERHRRDSPSSERHRKHSRNNSNNSGSSSNKLLSPDDNFKISARKSSLNNPSISMPKPHTNSPLVSTTKIEIKKSNIPSSPNISPADSSPSIHSSPKSITSSASQSPKSSPISHSPKKSCKDKEKECEKDKEKPKEGKKSTVTT